MNYFEDNKSDKAAVQQPITDPHDPGYDAYWRDVLEGRISAGNEDDGFGLGSHAKLFEDAMKDPVREGRGTAAGETPQEQSATAEAFGKEWEFTEEQADEVLKREWGYRHVDNMSELQNQDNFAGVFGGFIKTDEDGRFLQELFSMIGNHPAAQRLYLHLIQLAKR